jgi:phage protein D
MPSPSRETLSVVTKFDGAEKIGKTKLNFGEGIERIEVEQRMDAPDFFSIEFKIQDTADPQKFYLIDDLKLGMEVEIQLGYEDIETVFLGEVSYIEPTIEPGHTAVAASGYDFAHRMTRGTSSTTWGKGVEADQTVTTIAGDLISKSEARQGNSSDGLSAKKDSGSTKVEYHAVVNQNPYLALQQLVGSTGCAQDSGHLDSKKQVEFKAPQIKSSPVLTICRDKKDPKTAVKSRRAKFSLSTVRQVAKVEVRGYDPATKKAIKGECKAVSEAFKGTTGPKAAGKAHWGASSKGPVLTIVDRPVRDKKEAEAIAQSVFDGLSMQFQTAEIEIQGTPKVKAGSVVELKQFTKRFDGKYLVESCTHLVTGAGNNTPYVCILSLTRNAHP